MVPIIISLIHISEYSLTQNKYNFYIKLFFARYKLTFFQSRVERAYTLEMEFVAILVVARFLHPPLIQKRLLMINFVVTDTGVLELIT